MIIQAHHLQVAGSRFFVQEARPEQMNGTTLLLLHTAGQSGVQWRDALEPLTDRGYRLVVPDLPGHGHSEPAASGVTDDLVEYAEWALQVMDLLGIDRFVPVGCSIGGKIAQQLAASHHSRLDAAVSMCAESGPGRVKLHALRRELEDSAAPSRTDRTHLGTLAVVGRKVDPARAQLIARMHCREDPLVSTSDLIGWGTHDVLELLPEIGCPILFAAGEDDLWVDAAAVKAAAARTPHGRFVLLEGYGHYPMEEIPDFAARLDDWLGALLERATA